jgi:hypothetical protein
MNQTVAIPSNKHISMYFFEYDRITFCNSSAHSRGKCIFDGMIALGEEDVSINVTIE